MKQNDAVFAAVCAVLETNEFNSAVELTKEQRSTVIGMVAEGILTGVVDFSTEAKAKHDTPAKVTNYTTGMVSNHLRKDKRLNGGMKYEIKNPGSRAKKDAAIENMKLLQAQFDEGTEEWHEIEAAIAERELQIKTVKPTATINVEALPEALRYLVK